ncbi:MAG: hypothetical protein HGA45_22730 [Chloroflexales bacterium]|nr:hypothetical protein [Chloroflexales bacterium]
MAPELPHILGHTSSIARYPELALSATGVIGLPGSLPCCRSQDGRLCGHGTTRAVLQALPDGTWRLLPLCEACLAQADPTTVPCHLPEDRDGERAADRQR